MDHRLIRTDSILIDERRFPLVVSHFVDTPTEEAIALYLTRATAALDDGRPYALIIEAARLRDMSQAHRKKFADWLTIHRDRIRELCVGQAYVYGSIIQRMILRSVFLVSPLPVPYIVVKTRAEANQWCEERLRAAGITLPPEPVDTL